MTVDELRETSRRLARGVWLLDKALFLRKWASVEMLVFLKPTMGGMVVSEPYRGQLFDPQHAQVVKGGWDHEHCLMCSTKIFPGDDWWAALPPDQVGLCSDCHSLLVRSSQAMRAAGLGEFSKPGGRSEFEQAAAVKNEAEWVSSIIPRAMLMALEERSRSGEINRQLRLFACACVRRAWHLLVDQRSRDAVEVAERYADGLATPEELDANGFEANYAASDAYVSGGLADLDQARIDGVKVDVWPDGTVLDEKPGTRAYHAAKAAASLTARKVGTRRTDQGWFEGGAWVAACMSSHDAFQALAEAEILRDREMAYQATVEVIEEPLTATDPIAGAAEILARKAAEILADDAMSLRLRFYEDQWQADLLRCIFGNPFRPVAQFKSD